MANKIISPFIMLTEEESLEELKKIEEEKRQIRAKIRQERGLLKTENVICVQTSKRRQTDIVNKENPFINACSKAFKFIKDNLNVNINTGTLLENTNSNGVIANPLDKLAIRPKIKAQISLGPLEAEVSSEDIIKAVKGGKVPKRTY